MSDHPLSPIPAAEADRAYATLTSAFVEDPVDRWLLPDDPGYVRHFPTFLATLAEIAFTSTTAWQLDDYAAVSVWLPPGREPDAERIGTVLLAIVAPEKHAEMFAVLEQMDAAHPRQPHWYLPWMGVQADKQSRGIGSRLLASNLEYVDLSGVPAYLETSNPHCIPFYERHGFVVTGHTDAATCPPVTFMRRAGRKA